MMGDQLLFFIKGAGALLALALTLWHMATTPGDMSLARALRYLALLHGTALIAAASVKQFQANDAWTWVQWGACIYIVMAMAAAAASLLEDRGVPIVTNLRSWAIRLRSRRNHQ